MPERFTDDALKTVALANDEALRLSHEFIGTEHLLIGLIQSGTGVGSRVLAGFKVGVEAARLQVAKLVLPGRHPIEPRRLPLTPRSKSVFAFALEECKRHSHARINTGHILLALLDDENGVAFHVLTALGVTPKSAQVALTDTGWSE